MPDLNLNIENPYKMEDHEVKMKSNFTVASNLRLLVKNHTVYIIRIKNESILSFLFYSILILGEYISADTKYTYTDQHCKTYIRVKLVKFHEFWALFRSQTLAFQERYNFLQAMLLNIFYKYSLNSHLLTFYSICTDP